MNAPPRLKTKGGPRVLVVWAAFAAALAGCGNDGSAGAAFPEEPRQVVPSIAGVVFAPRGEFVALPGWWRWATQLHVLAPAYAAPQSEEPVGIGTAVSLSLVSEVDAADGHIDAPGPIEPFAFTDADGRYEFIDPAAENVDACRMLVAAGDVGSRTLTRAFVAATNTDIDAVSEAVVRVILDRLTEAPAVQLCDFSSEEILAISAEASEAAFNAVGETVFEVNESAFEKVANNRGVLREICRATGGQFDELSKECDYPG